MKKVVLRLLALPIALIVALSSLFSVSAAEQPVLNTRKDFNWGVCMHSSFYSIYGAANLEEQIHYLAEMGATLVRTGINEKEMATTDKLVKLCNAYGIKVLLTFGAVEGDESDYDYDTAYKWMKLICDRYNGKGKNGKISYIQIDNECDIKSFFKVRSGSGAMNEYDREHMELGAKRFNNYAKAIRDSGADIKIIINHGWTHIGFLDWLQEFGVDYDIIGLDWYGDMSASFANQGMRACEQAQNLHDRYGKDIIICETNYWPSTREAANEDNISNWQELFNIMNDAYSYPFVKGACVYQLCDQIGFEKGSDFEREAHFGLIRDDKYGKMLDPKPIYYELKKIWGGTDKKLITVDEVMDNSKDAGNDKGITSSEKTNASSEKTKTTLKSGSSGSDKKKGTETTDKKVKKSNDNSELLIDSSDENENENENSETVEVEEDVKESKKLSPVVIIAIIFGGVLVLGAGGFVTYLVISYKKTEQSLTGEDNTDK